MGGGMGSRQAKLGLAARQAGRCACMEQRAMEGSGGTAASLLLQQQPSSRHRGSLGKGNHSNDDETLKKLKETHGKELWAGGRHIVRLECDVIDAPLGNRIPCPRAVEGSSGELPDSDG